MMRAKIDRHIPNFLNPCNDGLESVLDMYWVRIERL